MSLESKIKLNAPAEEQPVEAQTDAQPAPEAEAAEAPAEAAEMPAAVTEDTAEPMEEMPVLVPDDYDTEEIDYAEAANLSDVVSAKETIQQTQRYQRPKLRGKEAWDNFWYHHKLKVIVITVSVFCLGLAAIMSIPKKYDHVIDMYADIGIGVEFMDEVIDQFMPYCEDEDGNGKKAINLVINNIYSTRDPYSSISAHMYLGVEFGGEFDAFIVILDKPHYNHIVNELGEGVFETIEGYPALISLKNSELVTLPSSNSGNSKELFIALLAVPADKSDDAKLVERHDRAVSLMNRILEAHPELAAQ